MKQAVVVVLLLLVSLSWAQEEEEIITETSCSLSIKTIVLPVDSQDNTGKVEIEALLTDNKGQPLEGQDIRMTATNGTLTCMPPTSFSHAEIPTGTEGCLKTQEDGTVRIYLVNIPFNRPGQVKAFCTYGDFKVSAIGAYSIKKHTNIHKKRHKKKR
jgi:hypothetical protein